jgi:hypothetical protein
MSSSLALLDLDSKSAAVETSTQTQPLNDDKCVQTTTTTTTRDDNHNDLSLALSDVDDAFSQFDVRTRAKADAAGRQPRTTSGADSLFAYFASLSPMSRQKENKSQTKPKKEEFVPNIALSSHSSSVSSIVANRSDDLKAETSPDLGIADLRDERRVLVRVKHLKRLRRLLADAVTTSADPSVRRALAVTRECCESAERADDELSRLKRSKERMAREISKSLNKTEELLTKTELNLKLN